MVVAKTRVSVSTAVANSGVAVSVVGIGLSLSLRLTLAVETTRVAAESRVSKGGVSTAVAEAISSVSSVAPQARVAVPRVATQAIAVAVVGVGLGLSLSSSKGRAAEQNSKPEHL